MIIIASRAVCSNSSCLNRDMKLGVPPPPDNILRSCWLHNAVNCRVVKRTVVEVTNKHCLCQTAPKVAIIWAEFLFMHLEICVEGKANLRSTHIMVLQSTDKVYRGLPIIEKESAH